MTDAVLPLPLSSSRTPGLLGGEVSFHHYLNTDNNNRDADDAVRGRDGYTFDGYRIRVEFPRASSRGSGPNRRQSGGYGRPSNRAKGYQLLVSGLPPTGSWQARAMHVYKNTL